MIEEEDALFEAHWRLELKLNPVVALALLVHQADFVEDFRDVLHSLGPLFSELVDEDLGVPATIDPSFADELIQVSLGLL